jgi:hypothetical protein
MEYPGWSRLENASLSSYVYIDDASVAFEAVMLKDMLVECRDEDDNFVVDPPLNLLRRVGLKKAVVWKRRDTGMVTIAFKILCLINLSGVSMISFFMCAVMMEL